MKVGYYLNDAKKKKLNWDVFLAFVADKPIDLVEISPETLESCGPFDVLFVRLTEALAEKNDVIIGPFTKYLEANPDVRVIDSVEGQLCTLDRQTMGTAIRVLNQNPKLNFYAPKSVCIDFSDRNFMLQIPSDFHFPAICKHTDAAVGTDAHIMDVVCTKESLIALSKEKFNATTPYVLQEYINHSGTIFKVYVIGSYVNIQRRVSFPDFPFDGQDPTIPFNFDSQKWKHELPPYLTMEITGKAPIPTQAYVETIAECIGQQLGLSFFGFDLITDFVSGKNAIIDINFMPGFVGVPDFFQMLYAHMMGQGKKID